MIHTTAIIDLKAKVSDNVKVGAYSVIGPKVEIGEGTEIKSHVSIIGNTKIGKNNKIYSFNGEYPQKGMIKIALMGDKYESLILPAEEKKRFKVIHRQFNNS